MVWTIKYQVISANSNYTNYVCLDIKICELFVELIGYDLFYRLAVSREQFHIRLNTVNNVNSYSLFYFFLIQIY